MFYAKSTELAISSHVVIYDQKKKELGYLVVLFSTRRAANSTS